MGMLKFEVPNSLPIEDAKKRVQALLSYWGRKYGVTSEWTGEKAQMKGKAMGVKIDGNLEVLAAKISGEASDPGMLLRGQAQKYLTRKFTEYLDPKKSLEDVLKGED
ncbi:MAG: polyhydroxyalkanoic acid system family protein [Myxococcota bacterium]